MNFVSKKRDKSPPGRLWLSQTTGKFMGVVETVFKLRRILIEKSHSLIKTLVLESWVRVGHSAVSAPVVVLDHQRDKLGHTKGWNDSGAVHRGFKLTSSTLVHHTISLVNFIPDKFNFKMEYRASQRHSQRESESQPLINTPSRVMYKHKTHTCKYLLNWENYTKGDLNLKWPKGGSSDIPKLIFLCPPLEKFSHKIKQTEWNASFDWYPEEMI